jgi:hypothetical protein
MKAALAFVAVMVPAQSQGPVFDIQVACDGPVPLGMRITALRPGSALVRISELLEFCAREYEQEEKKRI